MCARRLDVAFLWHMHQPSYAPPGGGAAPLALPWVRLPALLVLPGSHERVHHSVDADGLGRLRPGHGWRLRRVFCDVQRMHRQPMFPERRDGRHLAAQTRLAGDPERCYANT